MFRRRDEDENEYTIQPVNKNLTSSGFPAANHQAAQAPAQHSPYSVPQSDEILQPQQQSAVPFVKTSAASAQTISASNEPVFSSPKEPKPAPKPAAASNNFVPSALRAASQPVATVAATPGASQIPSFLNKGNTVKIDSMGLETERRLTVGYGISLEGKVSDCDKLVIYGSVNAELNNVKALQISDSGCFRGAAEIDYAEISGVFEGELKVRKSIVINNTGRVSGKITYGSIEIKPGGKFTGEIVEDKLLSQTNMSEESDEARGQQLTSDFSLFSEQKAENKAA